MSDDRQIHELLANTLGTSPPRPNFTRWRQRHAESVEILVSRAKIGGELVSRNLIPRLKAWIMDNKLKALGLSSGVVAAGAVIAWACWLSSAGDSSGAAVGPREGTQTAQSQQAPEATKPPPRAEAVAAAARGANKPTGTDQRPRAQTQGSFRARASRVDAIPFSMYIAGETLVMRGRVVEFSKEKFKFVPSKILYGRLQGDSAVVYPYPSREFADPYKAYLHVGVEIILGLAEFRRRGGDWQFRYNHVDRDTPRRSLNDREKEIREVVASGTYLVPPGLGPEYVGQYINHSDRIVRAELTARSPAKAEWRVEDVLYPLPSSGQDRGGQAVRGAAGKTAATTPDAAKPTTITIGLDPWRLRAEAIVRGRSPAREPNGKLDEDAVRQELQRLVLAELALGQKAILFVREPDGLGQDLFRRHDDDDLVGILKGDPTRSLDDIANALREVLINGHYRARMW